MKYLRITMPDESVWQVPAKLIAENRAKFYAETDPDTTYQEEYDFTMTDKSELIDWAANNMNWKDVKAFATKISDGEVDYEEGWCNGEKEVVDVEE